MKGTQYDIAFFHSVSHRFFLQHMGVCPQILNQSSYNLHRKHYTACSKRTPRRKPRESFPNHFQKHPQMHTKATLGPSLEPDLKRAPNLRSKGCPKGAQNASKKHSRRRVGTQLAHFCGQNAAIESIIVFTHFLNGF